MRTFGLVLLLVLAAFPVLAGPTASDTRVAADGAVRFTTTLGNPVGPSWFDLATNGSAWVKFIWFQSDCTDRADSTKIAVKMVIQLRDYTPPRSLYFPSGPDSAYVDLVTATEVIISR